VDQVEAGSREGVAGGGERLKASTRAIMADLQAGIPSREAVPRKISAKLSPTHRPGSPAHLSGYGGRSPGFEAQPKFSVAQDRIPASSRGTADQGNGPPASSRRSLGKGLFPQALEADAILSDPAGMMRRVSRIAHHPDHRRLPS